MSNRFEFELPFEEAGFRLVRRIGEGGMGTVYEALELATGRALALKVMPEGQLQSPEMLERFRREAKLAASISHPNCVFVYGVHEIRGLPAISMELLPGTTLASVMLRDELPEIHDCVSWMVQVIDGLEAAHQKGVLHRDVKPGNCFFDSSGAVKIGDFGLARATVQEQPLTQVGAFLGTTPYASPEAVRGKGYEMRSDMFSVGSTLYALLTGVTPFQAPDNVATMMRIITDVAQTPRVHRPEIPAELAAVVLKCLAPEPAGRFASYSELRAALARFAKPEMRGIANRSSMRSAAENSWVAAGKIGDYKVQSVISRTTSGRLLRALDPALDRTVWIHVYQPNLAEHRMLDVAPGDARSMIFRLRLIKSQRTGGTKYEVYESLEGHALREALEQGTFADWANAHGLFVELCEFLALDARPRHLEQLWIDSGGKLRVLDFPIGECPAQKLEPRALLAAIARAIGAAGRPAGGSEALRAVLREIADPASRLASVADIALELRAAAGTKRAGWPGLSWPWRRK